MCLKLTRFGYLNEITVVMIRYLPVSFPGPRKFSLAYYILDSRFHDAVSAMTTVLTAPGMTTFLHCVWYGGDAALCLYDDQVEKEGAIVDLLKVIADTVLRFPLLG